MGEIDDLIKKVSPYYTKKGGPEASHLIDYDSPAESLEPVYFWILDFLETVGLSVEKLVDNFVSSPGSGHFGEIGQRSTVMQQQAIQILGQVNTVLRSVLNIVYDLKEFKIRLQSYEDLKSDDKNKSTGALQSLKQIWLDKVDITKGNSSVKAMALGQAGFQTLLDAFLIAKDEKEADKLDLNDRVKRIVISRLNEFNIWLKESEGELKKRYNMERAYLKSQVNSLKLYSRWAKPYLKAAHQLEAHGNEKSPALVKVFSTNLLELTLLGTSEIDVKKSASSGDLPRELKNYNSKRKYYACTLVDFKFRGVPQRVSQRGDYSFGGRSQVTLKAYALNEEELKKLHKELDNSDVAETLKLIEGATTESLDELQEEINYFLKEEEKENKKEEKSKSVNPFMALFGAYGKKSETKKSDDSEDNKPIKPDNWVEKTHVRALAAKEAIDKTFTVFDTYKKAHKMESFT